MVELLHLGKIQIYQIVFPWCEIQCESRLNAVIISEIYRIVCYEMYSYTRRNLVCYADVIVVVQRILVYCLILFPDIISEGSHLVHLV